MDAASISYQYILQEFRDAEFLRVKNRIDISLQQAGGMDAALSLFAYHENFA